MPDTITIDDQIYDLLVEGADSVAERYYPKGISEDRGYFILVQALLHIELAPRIKDLLAKHGVDVDAEVTKP